MKPEISFNIIRILAIALILGVSYIFMPSGWSDWLFVVNVILFALSVASFLYWKIGNDPAHSALGLSMAARPLLLFVAAAALASCLFECRRMSLSLDLLWGFVWAFNLALMSGVISHFDSVQKQHEVSGWFKETDDTLRRLGISVGGTSCQKSYQALREDFRLSNKISCRLSEATESEISNLLTQLEEQTGDPVHFEQTANQMRRLLARRNQQIASQLNAR